MSLSATSKVPLPPPRSTRTLDELYPNPLNTNDIYFIQLITENYGTVVGIVECLQKIRTTLNSWHDMSIKLAFNHTTNCFELHRFKLYSLAPQPIHISLLVGVFNPSSQWIYTLVGENDYMRNPAPGYENINPFYIIIDDSKMDSVFMVAMTIPALQGNILAHLGKDKQSHPMYLNIYDVKPFDRLSFLYPVPVEFEELTDLESLQDDAAGPEIRELKEKRDVLFIKLKQQYRMKEYLGRHMFQLQPIYQCSPTFISPIHKYAGLNYAMFKRNMPNAIIPSDIRERTPEVPIMSERFNPDGVRERRRRTAEMDEGSTIQMQKRQTEQQSVNPFAGLAELFVPEHEMDEDAVGGTRRRHRPRSRHPKMKKSLKTRRQRRRGRYDTKKSAKRRIIGA